MMNYTVRAVLQPERLVTHWYTTSTEAPNSSASALLINSTHHRAGGGSTNWPVLLVLPWISIWGFIGNLMVCIAIYTDKRLQNITNYFLFSLAVADLLVCALVMPFSVDVELNYGEWRHGVVMCMVYIYADVFLCSASIVHMSVISLDRYLGISRPFKTRNKSLKVVMLKITLVWVVTVLISSPIAALAHHNKRNIMQPSGRTGGGGVCAITNRYYMLYGSTFAFLIPFVVMAVTYLKTTALLNQQAASLTAGAATVDGRRQEGLRRTMHPARSRQSYRSRQMSATSAMLSMSPLKLVLANQQTIDEEDGEPLATTKAAAESTAADPCAASPVNGRREMLRTKAKSYGSGMAAAPTDRQNGRGSAVTIESNSSLRRSAKTPHMLRLQRLKRQTQSVFWQLASAAGNRRTSFQTASQELANEHKATRVLAVVFICFFICWTPFFAMNFTSAFCGRLCQVPEPLASFFLWLGYTSSTVNPIIYTVFNRRFREAFWRICVCRCCCRRSDDGDSWRRLGGSKPGSGRSVARASTFHKQRALHNGGGGVDRCESLRLVASSKDNHTDDGASRRADETTTTTYVASTPDAARRPSPSRLHNRLRKLSSMLMPTKDVAEDDADEFTGDNNMALSAQALASDVADSFLTEVPKRHPRVDDAATTSSPVGATNVAPRHDLASPSSEDTSLPSSDVRNCPKTRPDHVQKDPDRTSLKKRQNEMVPCKTSHSRTNPERAQANADLILTNSNTVGATDGSMLVAQREHFNDECVLISAFDGVSLSLAIDCAKETFL